MSSIQENIETNLRRAFDPIHLDVSNESHMHSVPKGSSTHFKAVVVSQAFDGLMLLKRHRLVNECLASEISSIRALALHTFTPAEWAVRQAEELASPTCQGGSKK